MGGWYVAGGGGGVGKYVWGGGRQNTGGVGRYVGG